MASPAEVFAESPMAHRTVRGNFFRARGEFFPSNFLMTPPCADLIKKV